MAGMVAKLEPDPQLHTGVLAGPNHFDGLIRAHGHGLLDEDVLPGSGGGDGLGGVEEVGGRDEHRVNVGVRQQAVQGVVCSGYIVFLGERVGAADIATVNRRDVGVVGRAHGG